MGREYARLQNHVLEVVWFKSLRFSDYLFGYQWINFTYFWTIFVFSIDDE